MATDIASAPPDKPVAKMTPEERKKALAVLSTVPTYSAATVIEVFSLYGELDIGALNDVLLEQCKKVRDGNLRDAEFTLVAQAHSLDAIFANLARRAGVNFRQCPERAGVTM